LRLSLYFFFLPVCSIADQITPRDYEAEARKLYKDEPDYEKMWPVEFHIRIVESLLFDALKGLSAIGPAFYDDSVLKQDPLLVKGLKPSGSPQLVKTTEPIPDFDIMDFFAGATEIVWGRPGKEQLLPAEIRRQVWTFDAPQKRDVTGVKKVWQEYLSSFKYLDRYVIKPKKGKVPAEGVFESTASIEFTGKTTGGEFRRDYGKADITFVKTASGWRISRFALIEMTSEQRPKLMFQDATTEWLSAMPHDKQAKLRAESMSDEFYRVLAKDSRVESLKAGFKWFAESHARVAVVDLDGDTWDDLFVWDILGPAIFLHNIELPSGKRGFEDATDRFGLNFRDISNVVFADLNNDGSMDIILGRWSAPSELLLGYHLGTDQSHLIFVPANVNLKGILPAMVSAITVADVNKDGFLDIYFATSDQYYHTEHSPLEPSLRRLDGLVNRVGPRNVFLLGLGNADYADYTDHFGLEAKRSTLAASFADVNSDGYPDLVLANDFGPTNLFINENGGKFHDVSTENGVYKVFFGMGTSIGDYDNDGDLDLYITAMQSSAGQRITSNENNFDKEMPEESRTDRILGARGNILLRNDSSGKFTDVTNDKAYSYVRNANWAYGAQMVDFDNDSWLDIFSPNGHITLPRDKFSNTIVRDY